MRPGLLFVLAITACGGRPVEDKPADAAKKPEPPKAIGAKPDLPPAKLGSGMPPACADYRDAAERAASCEKLGGRRDALRADLEQSWAAWSKLDDTAKAGLTKTCADLAATIRLVVATACP
jgi:hypothetical protein